MLHCQWSTTREHVDRSSPAIYTTLAIVCCLFIPTNSEVMYEVNRSSILQPCRTYSAQQTYYEPKPNIAYDKYCKKN